MNIIQRLLEIIGGGGGSSPSQTWHHSRHRFTRSLKIEKVSLYLIIPEQLVRRKNIYIVNLFASLNAKKNHKLNILFSRVQ
jgi:hypothetical protein